MKIRNGFVSNSSSASFCILWKSKSYDIPLEQFLSNIDFPCGKIDDLVKNTEIINEEKNGDFKECLYKTKGYTFMLNDNGDIPDHIKELIVTLKINNRDNAELLNIEIE